jgi:hypothetical protein
MSEKAPWLAVRRIGIGYQQHDWIEKETAMRVVNGFSTWYSKTNSFPSFSYDYPPNKVSHQGFETSPGWLVSYSSSPLLWFGFFHVLNTAIKPALKTRQSSLEYLTSAFTIVIWRSRVSPELLTVLEFQMKLFVGNLPFSMDNEGLRKLFENAGMQVDSASVVEDRTTQRSRGFGFVETPNGQAAIDAISKISVEGRALTVNEARPMSNDRSGGGRGGREGGRGGRDGGRGGRDRY